MAVAWRVAAEKKLIPPLRRAWFILGVSFLMFLIGNVAWTYLEVVLGVEPFPQLQMFSIWHFTHLVYGGC